VDDDDLVRALAADPSVGVGARHHRLARFYLERFSDGGRVAVVDRRTMRRWNGSVTDVAAERDFYTTINLDGDKDGRHEQLLSQVEGDAARAIRNICNPVFDLFPPQQQDRHDLCLFLAFQRVRGRAARKRIELLGDLWAHIWVPERMTPGQADEWLRAHGHEATPTAIADLVSLSADMPDLEFVPDPNEHVRVMVSIAVKIAEYLMPRPWWLVSYDAPALLTSDEPVALHNRRRRQPGELGGIAGSDEIWFPLDPSHLLVLGRPDDPLPEQRLPAPLASARTVNSAVAAAAYEHIFMHPGQDHLDDIELPEPGPLFHVEAELPIDISRYNRAPARTGTQRRR
jgi:hypothetical protein